MKQGIKWPKHKRSPRKMNKMRRTYQKRNKLLILNKFKGAEHYKIIKESIIFRKEEEVHRQSKHTSQLVTYLVLINHILIWISHL